MVADLLMSLLRGSRSEEVVSSKIDPDVKDLNSNFTLMNGFSEMTTSSPPISDETWGTYFYQQCQWMLGFLAQRLHLDALANYIDVDFVQWLIWLFTPFVITFLLPFLIFILLYASALFFHIYKLRHRLKDAYARDFWDGAKQTIAALWDGQGAIWHGYEIVGLEKIPNSGPALLVYYHGTLPIDFYYLMSKCMLHKGRHIRAVGDRFLFKIPGWKLMMEVLRIIPGTIQTCTQILREGELLGIAPGGVREALFGDEFYTLMWGSRIGFARVALEAQAPIIPVFTQNCREAFRTLRIGRSMLQRLYEKTRLPLVPIYGGFPVKLRSFIGDPIPYDPTITAEELAMKAQIALQDLIDVHQQIPGSILRALLQRIKRKTQ